MADGKQAEVDVKGLKEEKIPTKLDGQGHEVFFDIDGVPEKLYVGDSCSLVVFGTCESGCDLVGDKLNLSTILGENVADVEFVTQEGELAVSEAIPLTMPAEPGKYQYVVHYEPRVLPMPEDGGPAFKNPHEERDMLLEFTVEPHHVAVSTWGVTAPVWVGQPIEVCVGVSCSSGCALGGQKIQIVDADEKVVAEGKLHEPEAPRETLWWDKLTAVAPMDAKLHRWEARFIPEGMDTPHERASHKFSFVARIPPERNFKICVIDDKTGKPQRSARCELKPVEGTGKAQFASTGSDGLAVIGAGKDKYTLKVTAPSRKSFTEVVDLTEHDLEVEVHLQPVSATENVPLKVISPAAEAAAEAAPAAEAPAVETPAVETSAAETPAVETPQAAPVAEQLAPEAPVVEETAAEAPAPEACESQEKAAE